MTYCKNGLDIAGLSYSVHILTFYFVLGKTDPDNLAYPDYTDNPDLPDTGESTEKERNCLNFLLTARVLFASNGNSVLGEAYVAQTGESVIST